MTADQTASSSSSGRVEPNAPTREATASRMVSLAWPILFFLMSQNLRLLVDTAYVSRLGDAYLAAQGLAAYLAILLLAPLFALADSVQAIVSRAQGAGDEKGKVRAVRAAIASAIVLGGLYTILLLTAAPFALAAITEHPTLSSASLEYLRPILFSIPFVGISSVFYGYWMAHGRTRVLLFVELLMQSSNVALGYLLIFGVGIFPELGIRGAGLALALSSVLGALTHLAIYARVGLILNPRTWPSAARSEMVLARMTWQNLQLNLQTSLALFGMYLIAQTIGATELAAFTVLIRLATVVIYPAQALGSAAASLAGRAMGSGNIGLADAWARCALKLGLVVTALLGAPLSLVPAPIVSALTGSPAIVEVAELPLRILGVSIIFSGAGFVLSALLAGTGGANRARRINLLSQWMIQLPAAIVVGHLLGAGLLGLWLVQSASRIIAAILLWREWRSWRVAGFAISKG